MEVKLNQLSKLKVIFALCSVILLAGCAGGAGDSGDSSGADYSQYDNSTLNCNLELKDSCTIRNLDLNGNVVLVKAKGVVLDGAKNGKVIVDSSVGDGDFTMKNCKGIKNVTVNGGGSNSLHFLNSVIDALVASKENVRLVLEGQSKITNVEVKASGVKLQGSTESEIAKVSISKTVTAIEVNGGSISSIIAAGKIEVKISSSETKIEFIKSVKDVVVTKDAGVNLETEPVKTENNSEVATEYEKIEEASEIPNTIRIIVDESYTKGIRFNVKNADGSDIVLNNKFPVDERIEVFVDGHFHAYSNSALESFVVPFVNQGEQVMLTAKYTRIIKGADHQHLERKDIAIDSKIVVPEGGYGIPEVEGDLKYTVDKYGTFRFSEFPKVSLKGHGLEGYSLVLNLFAADWLWVAEFPVNLKQAWEWLEDDGYDMEYPVVLNYYMNSYSSSFSKDGFKSGTVEPYISYIVKRDADDDGSDDDYYSGRIYFAEEKYVNNFTLLSESQAVVKYTPKAGDIFLHEYKRDGFDYWDNEPCYYFETDSSGKFYDCDDELNFILRDEKIIFAENDTEDISFVKVGGMYYSVETCLYDEHAYYEYISYEKVTSLPACYSTSK